MFRTSKYNNRFAQQVAAAFGGDFYDRRKRAEGEEVIVLKRTAYNGPNHKSIGVKEPGDIIRVAVGPYLDFLLQHEYVRRTADVVEGKPLVEEKKPVAPEPVAPEPVAPIQPEPTEPIVIPEPEPESEPTDTSGNADDAEDWTVFSEVVGERMAKTLWDAGFHSKADIVASYEKHDLVELVALPRIGESKAKELVKWAGVAAPSF